MTEPDRETSPEQVADLLDRVAILERRVQRERTARLEAEQIAEDGMRALYEANLDLDAKILERTEQLDAALAQARSAVQAKSAFLAHMTHHLMTPINGVVGMLELLNNADLDQHQRSWLQSATRSADRLDRLVRQLLAFVQVDGADLRTGAPVHRLSDVLASAEAQWHTPLIRAGQLPVFELAAGRELWVCDPPELSMLLSELFSNVIDHADKGPVAVRLRRVDETTAAIDVEDAGPGIPPELKTIADSLGVRADFEHLADDTASLGLVLMSRIADGLDGRLLLAERSPTTVTVELPLEQIERAEG